METIEFWRKAAFGLQEYGSRQQTRAYFAEIQVMELADALIEIAVRNGPKAMPGTDWPLYDPVRHDNPNYCIPARALGIL